MATDEKATLASRSDCMSTVRKAVERNSGRLVKTIGDGTLNEFWSTIDAMRAALEILGAMVTQNRGKPDDKCVELRMSVDQRRELVRVQRRSSHSIRRGTHCGSRIYRGMESNV
jgi:class 3 adenylate cyclase